MKFLRVATSFLKRFNNSQPSESQSSSAIKNLIQGKIVVFGVVLLISGFFFLVILGSALSYSNYNVDIMALVDGSSGKKNTTSINNLTSTGGHQEIVEKGKTVLGAPYSNIYSGNDPSGFTCSGFTWWSYQQAGFEIPIAQGYYSYYTGYTNGENSQMWAVESRGHWKDNIEECNPGDLVFYSPVHDKYNTGHVAIYMGNNEIIEANYGGVQISTAVTGTFVGCGWPLD